MPDWRNPDEYAYAQSLNVLGWAWEFLRRNGDYQAAYNEFLKIAEARFAEPQRVDLQERETALRAQLKDFGLLSFHSPERGHAVPLDPLWSDFISLPYYDPELNATKVSPLWLGAVGFGSDTKTIEQPYQRGTWAGFPYVIELTFSFEKPLDAQLEMAARFLKECERKVHELSAVRPEKPTIRFNVERFTLYLRLLDARRAGESIGEMGRALFGGKGDMRRSARLALSAAEEIAATRYKELLWITRLPPPREGEEDRPVPLPSRGK
jgi:hypothetical protein